MREASFALAANLAMGVPAIVTWPGWVFWPALPCESSITCLMVCMAWCTDGQVEGLVADAHHHVQALAHQGGQIVVGHGHRARVQVDAGVCFRIDLESFAHVGIVLADLVGQILEHAVELRGHRRGSCPQPG